MIIIFPINWLVVQSIKSLKGESEPPEAEDDVDKRLVLSSTQRSTVYCHRGGNKPGNIHM